MTATETSHDSCSTARFLKGSVASVKIREVDQVVVPLSEKAERLGNGVRLSMSEATAKTIYESDTELTTSSAIKKFPGF